MDKQLQSTNEKFASIDLLLDLLKNRPGLGYKPSFSSDETSNRAFADDLTLMSSRLEKLKEQIEVMERFLDWTRKMKAKPSKCIALGMKVIDGTCIAIIQITRPLKSLSLQW